MDEYYQADLNEMVKLTEGSSSASNIRSMERHILSALEFKLHCGREPMVFLNRLLRAAYTGRSDIGYEISILAMDILVLEKNFREINSAKKATASVLAARIILWILDEIEDRKEIWTTNLRYYAYEKNQENLKDMVIFIIMSVKNLLRQINVHNDERPNLVIKYTSRSKHQSLLTRIYGRTKMIEIDFGRMNLEAVWNQIF